MSNIIQNRDRGCLMCRIVSGSGLIGCGLYVQYHSKKFPKSGGKFAMQFFAGALVFLGTARLLSLPPFQRHVTTE